MHIIKSGTKLETSVYEKQTNTGLHFDSHVDHRCKNGLSKTMINRAYKLLLTWKSFIDECTSLKQTFVNFRYPLKLIDATINKFMTNPVPTNSKLEHAQRQSS